MRVLATRRSRLPRLFEHDIWTCEGFIVPSLHVTVQGPDMTKVI